MRAERRKHAICKRMISLFLQFFCPPWNISPLSFVYMYEVTKEMSTMLSVNPRDNETALLAIDEEEKAVYVDGEICELTQQEFYLLNELAQNADRPVSREQLLRDAWGYACPGETRTVDVHIQRLRKKLGFACIETVYRRGYRLRAQAV